MPSISHEGNILNFVGPNDTALIVFSSIYCDLSGRLSWFVVAESG